MSVDSFFPVLESIWFLPVEYETALREAVFVLKRTVKNFWASKTSWHSPGHHGLVFLGFCGESAVCCSHFPLPSEKRFSVVYRVVLKVKEWGCRPRHQSDIHNVCLRVRVGHVLVVQTHISSWFSTINTKSIIQRYSPSPPPPGLHRHTGKRTHWVCTLTAYNTKKIKALIDRAHLFGLLFWRTMEWKGAIIACNISLNYA